MLYCPHMDVALLCSVSMLSTLYGVEVVYFEVTRLNSIYAAMGRRALRLRFCI